MKSHNKFWVKQNIIGNSGGKRGKEEKTLKNKFSSPSFSQKSPIADLHCQYLHWFILKVYSYKSITENSKINYIKEGKT